MNHKPSVTKFAAVWICLASQVNAQQPVVEKPHANILWRPYTPPAASPAVLENSEGIHRLIRVGKLYLTLQDAIALAVENNLDLQVDRYGPLHADWAVERSQAGGPLKGSTSNPGNSTPTISGQGVRGAELAANVLGGGGNGNTNQNNGSFTQIGPVTPNLDPTLVANNLLWIRQTTPQANLQISGTAALLDIDRNFQPYLQQGFLTGGNAQVALQENYQDENSPGDYLRPSLAPVGYIYVSQRLLSGRGTAVNGRYIHVAQKQAAASRVIFRSQLLNLVANVVSTYWDLSGAQADLKAKETARATSQKFYEDTRKQIQIGALAGAEIYRAQAEVATRGQELAIAQQNVSQQELTLKDLIARSGLEDPILDAAEIVVLDHFEVPQSDDLPPLREMVATATANRPDVELGKLNNEAQEISALGTANSLLPSATGFAYTLNRAQAGGINPISPLRPAASQVGGLGTALEQIFTNQYNSRVAGVNFSGTIQNRAGQADYGIDQLQLRQGDLVDRKSRNDMVVAISNQAIAVRQAGLRYRNAVATRELQQVLLEKEQQKFQLGSSSVDLVIAAERILTSSQYAEIAALSAYSHARVALDQTLGTTLETVHVSVDDALKGKLARTQ